MTSKDWKICKLGNIIELIGGGTPNTSIPEYWNGNIPWISVKDFNNDNKKVYVTEKTITESGLNKSATKLLQKGDIIISARGTVGEIAVISRPMAFNQSCYGIKAIPNIVQDDFLYYLLKNSIQYLKHNTHGSVFDTITKETFEKIDILLPPLETQEKIARVLSSLDDKIELNNKINQNLEQQAQAIFKSWFVDFEPFGGKMPDDWKIGTISELGTVVGGSTPSKKNPEYYTNNGIAWITPKDLSRKNLKFNLKFISKGEIDITDKGFKNSSATIMPKGTVLFSSRAPIGYISIAQNDVTTNQGFKSVIPFQTVGTPYVYLYLKNNITLIENMAAGSTFKEVSGSIMQNIPALIPSKKILKRFNTLCDKIFRKQEYLEVENEKLTQLRDTLLPKLMSGEIDVDKVIK